MKHVANVCAREKERVAAPCFNQGDPQRHCLHVTGRRCGKRELPSAQPTPLRSRNNANFRSLQEFEENFRRLGFQLAASSDNECELGSLKLSHPKTSLRSARHRELLGVRANKKQGRKPTIDQRWSDFEISSIFEKPTSYDAECQPATNPRDEQTSTRSPAHPQTPLPQRNCPLAVQPTDVPAKVASAATATVQ